MDTRKNVKVNAGVKQQLQELKKHVGMKTESEVIGYLVGLYTLNYDKITVVQSERCREISQNLNCQQVV